MSDRCHACGGPQIGSYVCHHCGSAIDPSMSAEVERLALDELHGQLIARSESGEDSKLLLNAFFPNHTNVLIEAGLRMLPVLEDGVAQSGAAGRLRAVIIKLELLSDDPAAQRAQQRFCQALASYRRSDRTVGLIMSIILAGLLGCACLIIWHWFW